MGVTAAGVELPTGTVTFLFTDVEGSTVLASAMGDNDFASALDEHRSHLVEAIKGHRGVVFGTEGDAVFSAFARATDALCAALDAQRALTGHRLQARIGLHTGEAIVSGSDYVGLALHQVARVASTGHGGQTVVSETTQHLASRDLPDGALLIDLGAHRLKDLAEPQHLFQLKHADVRVDFPPLRSLAGRPNNLPLQLTSFVAREAEMEELRRLVKANRLVTLTGVGGCGKTRLALHTAAELMDDFPDGVWLIDLAPVDDEALVEEATAQTLQVAGGAGSVIDRTVAHVGDRAVLLVVDNCEHVSATAGEMVEQLLRGCARLQVLATSREALDVSGEVTRQIASLSIPEASAPADSASGVRYGAVRLFMERALAVDPDFALGPGDEEIVMRICRRLDGIPLAIELAAPKIRAFDLAEIDSRLDDRFRLLSGGTRRGLGRQQTLRAAVDWSFELLTPEERIVLRRLSIFSGGCTLRAAEEVCADADLDGSGVADALERLVGRSLLLLERTGTGARYRQLETIRQYGFEKLAEAGEVELLRARHLAWCSSLASQAFLKLTGPEQADWLRRLDAEAPNVRSALDWALDHDPSAGLRVANDLQRWWLARNYREGRERLAALLGRADADLDLALRARAELNTGWCASYAGDEAAAAPFFERALATGREADDFFAIGQALSGLGGVAGGAGDRERSVALYEEAVETFRASDPQSPYLCGIYNNLGRARAALGDLAGARQALDQAFDLARRLRHLAAIAFVANTLGMHLRSLGESEAADKYFDTAIETARLLGDRRTLTSGLERKEVAAICRGDYALTRTMLDEMEILAPEVSSQWVLLVRMCRAWVELADGERAAGLHLADDVVDAFRSCGDAGFIAFVGSQHADFLGWIGEFDRARSWAEEATALGRAAPYPLAWTSPALSRARIDITTGDFVGARARLDEIVRALEELDVPAAERAWAHFFCVVNELQDGDIEQATLQVTGLRAAGEDPRVTHLVQCIEGHLLLDTGDVAPARPLLEAAREHAVRTDDFWMPQFATGLLTELAVAEGDPVSARRVCLESLTFVRKFRHLLPSLVVVEATARHLVDADQDDDALRLFAGAQALREQFGVPIPPRSVAAIETAMARARESAGELPTERPSGDLDVVGLVDAALAILTRD